MFKNVTPQEMAKYLEAEGFRCTVEGDTIIAQDPVIVSNGTAQGRFVEFKAVTLRSEREVHKFLSDRS